MAANAPKVHFNVELAEAERAQDAKKLEPYAVQIGDRVITMTDANDLDWKVLLEIEHPVEFLKFCVPADDREFLRKQNISGYVFNEMIEGYTRHYGLGSKGNGAASRI